MEIKKRLHRPMILSTNSETEVNIAFMISDHYRSIGQKEEVSFFIPMGNQRLL